MIVIDTKSVTRGSDEMRYEVWVKLKSPSKLRSRWSKSNFGWWESDPATCKTFEILLRGGACHLIKVTVSTLALIHVMLQGIQFRISYQLRLNA
jgi:hypothetical protein